MKFANEGLPATGVLKGREHPSRKRCLLIVDQRFENTLAERAPLSEAPDFPG